MSKFIKKVVAGPMAIALAVSMLVAPFATSVTHAASAGGVYKTADGTVWFVTKDMQKRPFTSAGAFMSYGFLSWGQVQDADSSVTALPAGSFIPPQDGRIFCATETKGSDVAGECALITGGKKAAFTSEAVVSQQGFSFARAFYGDSSFLEKTSNIDSGSAQHRAGTLINNNGTVQLVVSGGLWGVPSMDVFNSWGWSFADVVPANSADVVLGQIGIIPGRTAGDLVPTGVTGTKPNPPANCNALDGSAGSIEIESSSIYSNEEVGEGQEEVPVMAFEVEADDDSDIAITSIRVELEHTGSGSKRLNRYADEVTIWYGDDMVGSASVSSFNESNNVYSRNITLDCVAIDAGSTEEITVAMSALNNIDSVNLGENWEVDVTSVRFIDGDRVTTTESTDSDNLEQTFSFVDFATAADVELRVALNDNEDEINQAHNIIVDEDVKTTNEPVLAFNLQARGDSDITIETIPVVLTTNDSDLDTVVTTAHLYQGSSKIATENITTNNSSTMIVQFDDLDVEIDAGDTEGFEVRLDFAKLSGNYDEGTTVKAEITGTQVDQIEAEDEQGDELNASELTGAALGGTHSLFSDGIVVEVNSARTEVNSNDGAGNDTVEFIWELTISNIGDDDVYINRSGANITDTDAANPEVDMVYTAEDAGITASYTGTITDTNNATEVVGGGDFAGQNFYKLAPGQSKDFRVTVSGANTSGSAQVRAYLSVIEWTTNDVTSFTGTEVINDYTAQLPTDSRTPYRLVN